MQKLSPYLRLMRLHQPVGIWLVFWPCAWAIALSGAEHLHLLVPFFAGSVLMRGLGCVLNDMADREFDKYVERTKARPLASGELSMKQALAFGAILAVLTLGVACWVYAVSSPSLSQLVILCAVTLAMSAAYPFMKRITWWPQLFLGLTFNLGVLFAALAVGKLGEPVYYWLYTACIFWTLGYDTIYGFMDQKDDEKIGVKSTSRHLATHGKLWVFSFYLMTAVLMLPIAPLAGAIMILFVTFMLRQIDLHHPASCLRFFKSNALLGLLIFCVIYCFPTIKIV